MNKTAKIVIGIVVVVLVVWGLSSMLKKGGPVTTPGTSDGYSIGSVIPLSVNAASYGQPYAEGMQMAVDDVNKAGGINNKKLSLYIEDGQFFGAKSVSATQDILSLHNPDIVHAIFDLPGHAISPVVLAAGKPFILWDYARSVLDSNPLAFKTGFDAKSGCEQLIQYAKSHGAYKKLGILLPKAPYSDDCFAGIKNVEPGVQEYWYQFGEKDFKTLLAKAHQDGVDAVVTVPIDPEAVLMFKQLGELGYPIKMICATSSECIYPAVIAVAPPKVLEGTISVDFVPPNFSDSAFAKKLEAKNNKAPDAVELTYASKGYDDVMIIAKAMSACAPHDSQCLVKALADVKDYNSVIGSTGFKDRVEQLSTRIQRYENGKWVDVK